MTSGMAKSRENTGDSENGISRHAILEKAVKKAINNGWMGPWAQRYLIEGRIDNVKDAETLLYNHSFAKALWGNKASIPPIPARNHNKSDRIYILSDLYVPPTAWEFHVQQMAVAKDPIAYLGANI